MGNRYAQSDENKKIVYVGADNLYAHSISQPIPYNQTKIDKNVEREDILNTPDESDVGCFIECYLKYPDEIKEKTKHFSFALGKKSILSITLVIIWMRWNQIIIQKLRSQIVIGLIKRII